MEFEEIISLKEGEEKHKKLIEWYTNNVNISKWLTNPFKNCIIRYHDRIEYKKNDVFHRLNGPALEYQGVDGQTTEDKYYYRGKCYDNKEEWLKVTMKELRKLKLKQIEEKI